MVLVVVAVGCAEDAPRTTSGTTATSQPAASGPAVELAAARARWEANRPLRYEMRYHALGLFPDSVVIVTVTVNGDEVTASSVDGNLSQIGRLSVADLFNVIEAAIENPATSLRPIYHEAIGYPVSYWIDHEDLVPDQESGLEVLSLDPTAPTCVVDQSCPTLSKEHRT